MHAELIATLYNAHFKNDGVAFTSAQLTGKEDRAAAVQQARRERMELMKLSGFVMNQHPEWVPDFIRDLAESQKQEQDTAARAASAPKFGGTHG